MKNRQNSPSSLLCASEAKIIGMALMYHPTSSHCIPSEITQCRATHNGANSFANMVLSAKNKEIASGLSSHTRSSLNLTKGWSFDGAEVKQRRGYQVIVAASPPTEDAVVASEPLTKEDLVGYLASGCKPKEKWRIGTGHEKFGFEIGTLRPIKYDQIAELLNGISERFDWEKIMEGEYIIGLKQGKQSISLEPGGQFELSGAPLETLHQTCAEVNSHLYQVKAVAEEMGIGFLGVGFQPKWKREDIPVMPKGRYAIMKNYMPKVGTLGLDMMFRTCTVQVNYHLLRSFTKFLHTQVSWSASCTEKKQLRSTIKAQAMELTKEAHSYREKGRIPKDPWHQADTAIDNRHALWPPENKADNSALNNPLLRQERMGCGWLGVIFEWEGVLVEENPDHEKQAWLTLALEEGKSPPPAFMLPRIEGMKNEQAIGEVLCWSRDPSELKRMSSRKEDIYNFLHGGDYKFRPGSQSFVNVLTNHKVPMALVSTRPRKSIERAIAVIGIENVFSVIVAAEDVHRGKPDPEMFSYAGQLLQFIPERCIVFGNSNLTVEAARDARMKCVAVASKHPVYELGAADIVVSRLDELSVVDLKNLADIESPEFGLDEPEMEMEVEEDDIDDRYSSSSSSGGFYDDFW